MSRPEAKSDFKPNSSTQAKKGQEKIQKNVKKCSIPNGFVRKTGARDFLKLSSQTGQNYLKFGPNLRKLKELE